MRAVLIICASALALVGCRQATNLAPSDAYRVSFGSVSGYSYVSVFTDPDTGCDYFMTDDGFLSPRLTPDGAQLCRAAPPRVP